MFSKADMDVSVVKNRGWKGGSICYLSPQSWYVANNHKTSMHRTRSVCVCQEPARDQLGSAAAAVWLLTRSEVGQLFADLAWPQLGSLPCSGCLSFFSRLA